MVTKILRNDKYSRYFEHLKGIANILAPIAAEILF